MSAVDVRVLFDESIQRNPVKLHSSLVELSQSDNPWARDSRGRTALMWAARRGFVESCRLMLQFGARVGDVSECGDSAAHFAARRHSHRVLALIAAHGGDMNVRNEADLTPWLMVCAADSYSGHVDDALECLNVLRLRCKIDACDANNRRAILVAAAADNVTVVRYLIRHRCFVPGSADLHAALCVASRSANRALVALLIDAGASAQCAVVEAVEAGNADIVRQLGRAGASLAHVGLGWSDSLLKPTLEGNNVDLLSAALELGLPVRSRTLQHAGLLSLTIAAQAFDAAFCLLEADCDVTCDALYWCLRSERLRVAEMHMMRASLVGRVAARLHSIVRGDVVALALREGFSARIVKQFHRDGLIAESAMATAVACAIDQCNSAAVEQLLRMGAAPSLPGDQVWPVSGASRRHVYVREPRLGQWLLASGARVADLIRFRPEFLVDGHTVLSMLVMEPTFVRELGAQTNLLDNTTFASARMLMQAGAPINVHSRQHASCPVARERFVALVAGVAKESYGNGIDCAISAMERQLQAVAMDLHWRRLRKHIASVCLGLHGLNLPALVTLAIVDQTNTVLNGLIPMHFKWNVIVAVKHWHEKNAGKKKAGKRKRREEESREEEERT